MRDIHPSAPQRKKNLGDVTPGLLTARVLLWAHTGIDAWVASIASTAEGGRASALRDGAARCYRLRLTALDCGGHLPEQSVTEALSGAARACGLDESSIASTLHRAQTYAREQGPADLPPRLADMRRALGTRRPAAPSAGQVGRTHLPHAEVREFWESCGPVCDDSAMVGELRDRGFDPAPIVDLDLARVLPAGRLPRWARSKGGDWRSTGHRLVFPMFDDCGEMRGVFARTLRRDLPEGALKALWPLGHTARGLLCADAAAQALLRGERSAWWDGRAIITEGAPSYLALACLPSDGAEQVPATFGYMSGSWTAAHAERIPAGAQVVLWPHDDVAGRQMADKIIATLAHCDLKEIG